MHKINKKSFMQAHMHAVVCVHVLIQFAIACEHMQLPQFACLFYIGSLGILLPLKK